MNKYYLDKIIHQLRLSTKARFDDINLKEFFVLALEDSSFYYRIDLDEIFYVTETDRLGIQHIQVDFELFIIQNLNIDLHTYQCLFSRGDQPDLHPSLPPIGKNSSPEDFANMLTIFRGIA